MIPGSASNEKPKTMLSIAMGEAVDNGCITRGTALRFILGVSVLALIVMNLPSMSTMSSASISNILEVRIQEETKEPAAESKQLRVALAKVISVRVALVSSWTSKLKNETKTLQNRHASLSKTEAASVTVTDTSTVTEAVFKEEEKKKNAYKKKRYDMQQTQKRLARETKAKKKEENDLKKAEDYQTKQERDKKRAEALAAKRTVGKAERSKLRATKVCRRDDANSNQILFTHPHPNLDPRGFNVCLQHQMGMLGLCVPALKANGTDSSNFQATFPRGVEGNVRIMWMWDVVDWSQFRSRSMMNPPLSSSPAKHWNGCDVRHNFKNTLWCDLKDALLRPSNVGDVMDGKKHKDFAPLINHTRVETLFFVGDSTMKRVFDSAQKMCPKGTKSVKYGKLNKDAKRKCGTIKLIYLKCKGFCDTAERILNEVPNNTSIALLFNTGHQYINMNNPDFLQAVQKLRKVINGKNQVNWATWTNPAQDPMKWTNDMKCSHNNVLVQMKNDILRAYLPMERMIETFWYTLQSGYHRDGVHLSNLPYLKMLEGAMDIWLAR